MWDAGLIKTTSFSLFVHQIWDIYDLWRWRFRVRIFSVTLRKKQWLIMLINSQIIFPCNSFQFLFPNHHHGGRFIGAYYYYPAELDRLREIIKTVLRCALRCASCSLPQNVQLRGIHRENQQHHNCALKCVLCCSCTSCEKPSSIHTYCFAHPETANCNCILDLISIWMAMRWW